MLTRLGRFQPFELPHPCQGGPVGLACPKCPPDSKTSMKYISERNDAYLIGCSVSRDHHTRHWKCHKLFFEIAEINRGAPRPVIYNDQALDRRAPDGSILECQPKETKKRRVDTITCAYEGNPNRSQGHKSLGNKNCTNLSCQSCCRDLGPLKCAHHGNRVSTGEGTSQISNFQGSERITVEQSSQRFFATQASTIGCASQPVMSNQKRGIDVICTQAGSLPVGKPLYGAAFEAFDRSMKERTGQGIHEQFDDAHCKELAEPITIYCWIDEEKPVARTHQARAWPKFRLDEHPTLVQDICDKDERGKWNRQIFIWDAKPEVQNWREVFIDYSHSYTPEPRIILCRLKTVEAKKCTGLDALISLVSSWVANGPSALIFPKPVTTIPNPDQKPVISEPFGTMTRKERVIDLTSDDEPDWFTSDHWISVDGSQQSNQDPSRNNGDIPSTQTPDRPTYNEEPLESSSSDLEDIDEALARWKAVNEVRRTLAQSPVPSEITMGHESPHETPRPSLPTTRLVIPPGTPPTIATLSTQIDNPFDEHPIENPGPGPLSPAPAPGATSETPLVDSDIEIDPQPLPLPMWPTPDTKLSDLLSWYPHLSLSSSVVTSWRTTFGEQFQATTTNIFGYGRFLRDNYDILKEWDEGHHGSLLSTARTTFKAQWMRARHLKGRKPPL